MKKYFIAFITHYLYFYFLGCIAFFLGDLLINILGLIASNSSFSFSNPYVGMMIPPIIVGLYGVYKRWKEPNEIESYLDAQDDKQKIEAYLSESKSITNISDSVVQDKQDPKD